MVEEQCSVVSTRMIDLAPSRSLTSLSKRFSKCKLTQPLLKDLGLVLTTNTSTQQVKTTCLLYSKLSTKTQVETIKKLYLFYLLMKSSLLKSKELNFRIKLRISDKELMSKMPAEINKTFKRWKRKRSKYLILSKSINRKINNIKNVTQLFLMRKRKLKERRLRSSNNCINSTKSTRKDVSKSTTKRKLLINKGLRSSRIKEIRTQEDLRRDSTSLLCITVRSLKRWKKIRGWSLISRTK